MSKNIKIFDTQVTLILSEAYKVFPKSFDLDIDDLENFLKSSRSKISLEEHQEYCGDTMLFLEKNGFIEIGTKTLGGGYIDVRLTLKGLTLLKQQPKSISDEPSVGEMASKKIKEGLIDSAIAIITNALTKFI